MIETGVESKGSSGRHDGLHAREGQTEDTSESVVDADGPSHSLLTLDGREDFGGVLESYRTLSQGIADGKKVDKQDDWSDLRASATGVLEQR